MRMPAHMHGLLPGLTDRGLYHRRRQRSRGRCTPRRAHRIPVAVLYRLYIGIADGMPIARVLACRYIPARPYPPNGHAVDDAKIKSELRSREVVTGPVTSMLARRGCRDWFPNVSVTVLTDASGARAAAHRALVPARPAHDLNYISASPTEYPLRGYGRAGIQNDRLAEADILSTGTPILARWTCRRRCRYVVIAPCTD